MLKFEMQFLIGGRRSAIRQGRNDDKAQVLYSSIT
jgi:hypothetical protein